MKVIDTRGGDVMIPGQTARYPEGESLTLLQVEPGILRARALVRHVYRDLSKMTTDGSSSLDCPLQTWEGWVPLVVRWTHPAFFLQHVAFLPS